MSRGLLKRASSFLLASAMVLNVAGSTLAEESPGPETVGTEKTTEATQADEDVGGGTEKIEEPEQTTGSYIICLPEGAGAQYSYDGSHKSEENSDDAFTILLYEEGEEVSIGVESELGFALYGTEGNLFLEPDGGRLDFAMPGMDLQLVFDETQGETQAQPYTPALPDESGSVEPENGVPGETKNLQETEAGREQGTEGTGSTELESPGEGVPGTPVSQSVDSLKWEAANVSVLVRMANGGSFPEGAVLNVDTPDTAMGDDKRTEAYGKAVADTLTVLEPDAQAWALYPFEVTLGDGAELPEGQTEFNVTFSDKEIIKAFQSGIGASVVTYAMDHETLTVSDAEMVAAEDMDAYLTDEGKLSVDFLTGTGDFAISFLKGSDDDADPREEAEAEKEEGPETEATVPETFGYENLRFTGEGYVLQKDKDGSFSSHVLLGLAADDIGDIPATEAEVTFRFVLAEGMSASEMKLADGKVVGPDGETCIELWKADESLPVAITAVTTGNGVLDVVVTAEYIDGMANPFYGLELMFCGIALRYDNLQQDAVLEGTTDLEDVSGDAADTVDAGSVQVYAHAVLMATSSAEDVKANEEVSLDASSTISIQDAKDDGNDIMPAKVLDHTEDIGKASLQFGTNGIFVGFDMAVGGCTPDNVEVGSDVDVLDVPGSYKYRTYTVHSTYKRENGWIRFPNSFWAYQADGSVVNKFDKQVIDHPSSCDGFGYGHYECSVCGKRGDSFNLRAGSHAWVEEVVPPTCTAYGYTKRTCSKCGRSEEIAGTRVAKTAHNFTEKSSTPASCETDGVIVKRCSVCDLEETVVTGKRTGHSWGTPVTVEKSTCLKEGKVTYTCTTCNVTKEVTTPRSDHRWVLGADRNGLDHCADCGKKCEYTR